MRSLSPPVAGLVVVVILTFSLLGGPNTLGQEPSAAPARISYPAYLQAGRCDQPGDPVAALAMTAIGSTSATDDETPVPGRSGVLPAAVSVTEIAQPLADLLRDELIVRVVESEGRPDVDIACGAIGGQPDEDGNLYLAVSEQEDSGVTGIVWLQGEGDATTVTLFLIPAIDGSNATPAS